jgi:REP element-mobilizing transposase RayT
MAIEKFPHAYHITWGTYGTRLHGDPRGTVERRHNIFGEPIIDHDADWQRIEASQLRFPPRVLTTIQCRYAEGLAEMICQKGGWTLVAFAAAPDHVHVVLQADADGKAIRKWFKRWLGEALSEQWPLKKDQTWWAECGSVKWIFSQDYLERATHYVKNQRATR